MSTNPNTKQGTVYDPLKARWVTYHLECTASPDGWWCRVALDDGVEAPFYAGELAHIKEVVLTPESVEAAALKAYQAGRL